MRERRVALFFAYGAKRQNVKKKTTKPREEMTKIANFRNDEIEYNIIEASIRRTDKTESAKRQKRRAKQHKA